MAAGRYVAFVVLGGTKFSCSINSSAVPSRLPRCNSGLSRQLRQTTSKLQNFYFPLTAVQFYALYTLNYLNFFKMEVSENSSNKQKNGSLWT